MRSLLIVFFIFMLNACSGIDVNIESGLQNGANESKPENTPPVIDMEIDILRFQESKINVFVPISDRENNIAKIDLYGLAANLFTFKRIAGGIKLESKQKISYQEPRPYTHNSYPLLISVRDSDGLITEKELVIEILAQAKTTAKIVFPPPKSNLGGNAETTTVIVNAKGQDGSSESVVEVSCNGVQLQRQESSPHLWMGKVNIAGPKTELLVSVSDSFGDILVLPKRIIRNHGLLSQSTSTIPVEDQKTGVRYRVKINPDLPDVIQVYDKTEWVDYIEDSALDSCGRNFRLAGDGIHASISNNYQVCIVNLQNKNVEQLSFDGSHIGDWALSSGSIKSLLWSNEGAKLHLLKENYFEDGHNGAIFTYELGRKNLKLIYQEKARVYPLFAFDEEKNRFYFVTSSGKEVREYNLKTGGIQKIVDAEQTPHSIDKIQFVDGDLEMFDHYGSYLGYIDIKNQQIINVDEIEISEDYFNYRVGYGSAVHLNRGGLDFDSSRRELFTGQGVKINLDDGVREYIGLRLHRTALLPLQPGKRYGSFSARTDKIFLFDVPDPVPHPLFVDRNAIPQQTLVSFGYDTKFVSAYRGRRLFLTSFHGFSSICSRESAQNGARTFGNLMSYDHNRLRCDHVFQKLDETGGERYSDLTSYKISALAVDDENYLLFAWSSLNNSILVIDYRTVDYRIAAVIKVKSQSVTDNNVRSDLSINTRLRKLYVTNFGEHIVELDLKDIWPELLNDNVGVPPDYSVSERVVTGRDSIFSGPKLHNEVSDRVVIDGLAIDEDNEILFTNWDRSIIGVSVATGDKVIISK